MRFACHHNYSTSFIILLLNLIIPISFSIQQPFKRLRQGSPVRLRVNKELTRKVWTPFQSEKDDEFINSPLHSYMQLPAAQYSCVPMPLKSYLTRIYGTKDRFLLGVPPVQFRLPKVDVIEVSPVVQAVVNVHDDKVTIDAESCEITSKSEWVQSLKLNDRFDIVAGATLTWNATESSSLQEGNNKQSYNNDTISCLSNIEIDVYPPGKFRFIPRRLMEPVGNTAMNFIVSLLQEDFMKGLGNDYKRWATDSTYRAERQKLEDELILEVQRKEEFDSKDEVI